MIILIVMYRKRQNYILRTVVIVFFNIDFQRPKGGFMSCEKKTLIIFHLILNKRELESTVI